MTIQQSSKKFIPVLTVVMAALAAMSPLATDTYIAALPQIATEFGVGLNIAELTISLYFFGFAVGNFIGGPLSDSFGRKTVALVGVSLYGLAGLAIPLCPKIEYVLLLRFVQAFGGGFATVTTNVFIRDWYSGKQVARFITIISMIIGMAPLLAPVLGTWLIHWWGWRSVFVFLFGFALLLFLSVFFLIPESRPQHLLTRKLSGRHLLEKYRAFFASRQSTVMLFAISLPMAGLYVFITSASFIYIKYFGVDPMKFPLFFGSNVLLNMLLSLLNTYLLRRYKPEQILRAGLLIQLFAAVSLAVAVCLPTPKLWMVFASIVLFVGSLGLVFGNGSATILNHNPAVAGSANATIGITRFLLGFAIGSISAAFHTGTLIPFGIILLVLSLSGNVLLLVAARLKG